MENAAPNIYFPTALFLEYDNEDELWIWEFISQ